MIMIIAIIIIIIINIITIAIHPQFSLLQVLHSIHTPYLINYEQILPWLLALRNKQASTQIHWLSVSDFFWKPSYNEKRGFLSSITVASSIVTLSQNPFSSLSNFDEDRRIMGGTTAQSPASHAHLNGSNLKGLSADFRPLPSGSTSNEILTGGKASQKWPKISLYWTNSFELLVTFPITGSLLLRWESPPILDSESNDIALSWAGSDRQRKTRIHLWNLAIFGNKQCLEYPKARPIQTTGYSIELSWDWTLLITFGLRSCGSLQFSEQNPQSCPRE